MYFVSEIIVKKSLFMLIKNHYGNYVVKKAFELGDKSIKCVLISNIFKILPLLENKIFAMNWHITLENCMKTYGL